MTNQSASASAHPMTPWGPDDFAPHIRFSGAHKLANSGVAPLVAVARGYMTLEPEAVANFAERNNLGGRNTKPHSQLMNVTRRGETTVLFWYRADQVALDNQEGRTPFFTTMQLRPSAPSTSAAGKLVKYENLVGSESVIDANPATPSEWFSRSPRILITEGVMKGDSALTAQLRCHGIHDDELAVTREISRVDARAKLHELMLRVPADNRVTILSLIGVANWKGNDVWEALHLADRELLLAFDGDVETNWNVWNQANKLWTYAVGEKAMVQLVDLKPGLDAELENIVAGEVTEKVGLDNFLAKHGFWGDLMGRLRTELPDAPPRSRDSVEVGAWKVAVDGNSVQEFASIPGLDGQPSGACDWRIRVNIGGRISAVETHRAPSMAEIKTARFGAGLDAEDIPFRSTCRVELQWLNDDLTTETAVVTGPATLLMYPPSEWDKRKAVIPNNLLMHPEWPPERGQKWLSAIKDNNDVPAELNVSWTTMGWVPVEDSRVCSFISGRTVISPRSEDKAKTVAGVTDVVLPGASHFSLPASEIQVLSPSWTKQVRADLRAIREHYIDLAPWSNLNVAAVVLAAGMRPTVPIDCTTSIWLQGPPGQGKSWTVSQILSFHQERATWTNKKLPGSMKDTSTGVEQALSQTNIWVMDDLAPSPDRRMNDLEQAKIGDIVRSVYNKSAKRRSGVDLKAREVFIPHALLLITAENEHTINSVRDRTVILNLDKNSLRNDAARLRMDRFRDNSRAPGRLTVAAVQAFQHLAALHGWGAMLESVQGRASEDIDDQMTGRDMSFKAKYTEVARSVISEVKVDGKSDARHVEMAVDLMLGLAPLRLLADMVGDEEMQALLDPNREGSLPARVAAVISTSFQSQGEATPGRSIVDALRDLLAAGGAHILNVNDPGLPPLPLDDVSGNRALGWQTNADDKPRPLGVSIGHLKCSKSGALDAVLLNPVNAFDAAQRRYPKILPPGTTATTTFGSLWNESLIHPDYMGGGRDEGRATKNVKLNQRSVRVVPIHIDHILGAQIVGDEDDSDEES